jgi:hypothetical protein
MTKPKGTAADDRSYLIHQEYETLTNPRFSKEDYDEVHVYAAHLREIGADLEADHILKEFDTEMQKNRVGNPDSRTARKLKNHEAFVWALAIIVGKDGLKTDALHDLASTFIKGGEWNTLVDKVTTCLKQSALLERRRTARNVVRMQKLINGGRASKVFDLFVRSAWRKAKAASQSSITA